MGAGLRAMLDKHLRLTSLALLGALPLMIFSRAQDVVFGPWRAALWVYLGSVLCVSAFRWLLHRAEPVLHAVALPWALFSAWVLVATFWSVNPADSFRRALDLVGAVIALWLGLAFAPEWGRFRSAALVSALLCSLYGMVQVVGLDPMPWATGFGGRAFGTLGNPDYYAGHLLLVLPVGLVLLMSRTRGKGFAVRAGFVCLTRGLFYRGLRRMSDDRKTVVLAF